MPTRKEQHFELELPSEIVDTCKIDKCSSWKEEVIKRFSQEYKDSEVAVYEQGGVTYKQLALELGVSQASFKKSGYRMHSKEKQR